MAKHYCETERAAERRLEREGFEPIVPNNPPHQPRFNWQHPDGRAADIRFNSTGIYIAYQDD